MTHYFFSCLNIFLCLAAVFTYHFLGGYYFPDYTNYITIADGTAQGMIYHQHFAEWITRQILYSEKFLVDPKMRVDALVLITQALFMVYTLACSRDKSSSLVAFLIICMYSPLFLTTIVRASMVYVLFSVAVFFYSRSNSINWIFWVCFIGSISFHDSGFLAFGAFFIFHLLISFGKKSKMLPQPGVVFLISILFLLVAPVRNLIISYLPQSEIIGRFAVYLYGDTFSVLKYLYVVFISAVVISFLSVSKLKSPLTNLLLYFLAALNLMALLSPTASIRFSIFVVIVFFVLIGANRMHRIFGVALEDVVVLCSPIMIILYLINFSGLVQL